MDERADGVIAGACGDLADMSAPINCSSS